MVLDLAHVLIMDVYREYGMKFEEAAREIDKAIGDETQQSKAKEADDAASMAMLQAMMSGSDFGGPRG